MRLALRHARPGVPAAARPATLAFLHGSAGSASQWQAHMQRLGVRYRTRALTLLGYAGTPGWPTHARITLGSEADHVAQQLDDPADPVHLVAHGYGAAVALHAALRHPARVRSLVLYEPVLLHILRTRPELPADAGVGGALSCAVQRRYESGDLSGAAWVFVDYWCGDGAWQRLPASEQAAIAARIPKIAAELRAALTEATPLARYAELRLPVLLMHGARTRSTARQIVQSLARTLHAAEVLELPGADHLGAVTHPDTLCTLVDDFVEAQRDGAHRFAWTQVLRSGLGDPPAAHSDSPQLQQAPALP